MKINNQSVCLFPLFCPCRFWPSQAWNFYLLFPSSFILIQIINLIPSIMYKFEFLKLDQWYLYLTFFRKLWPMSSFLVNSRACLLRVLVISHSHLSVSLQFDSKSRQMPLLVFILMGLFIPLNFNSNVVSYIQYQIYFCVMVVTARF